jgi:GAF domain-containing protein
MVAVQGAEMARDPKKGGAPGKKRSKKVASGRRSAPTRPQKRARKSVGKVTRATTSNRAASLGPASLKRELKEARARQAATAEILKIIASSPSDVQPVFEAIASSANRLLGGHVTAVQRVIEGSLHLAAFTPLNPEADALLKSVFPAPSAVMPFFDLLARGEPHQEPDIEAIPDEFPKRIARARGFRSMLFVPLVNAGQTIGLVSVTRVAAGTFATEDVQLLQTFASQAVIAIENARLFNETQEALARQTATSDVLKVIASSPSNLQPVFDAIAQRSKALIGGHSTIVVRYVDGMIKLEAFTSVSPEADTALRAAFPRPISSVANHERIVRGELVETVDTQADSEPERSRTLARARDYRSRLMVPLRGDSGVIGTISTTRKEPGAFADKDKELLETFADQAVIAIQNVELFEEVQARTRDLEESLQQQTATADVLKVISRSAFDLQTVLDTLVESAAQLCEADEGIILQPKGDGYGLTADWGVPTSKREFLQRVIFRAADGRLTGAVLKTGSIVHVGDVLAEPEFIIGGDPDPARTRLGVPLLRDGIPAGVFVLTRREVRPFTDRQIELVQTFADQAVIAIENTRLINETREALARQTATAEVLKVIASSPSNLQPVFDAIAARSNELVAGHSTTVFRFAGDMVELVGATSVGAEADAVLRATFPMPVSRMRNIEKILRGEISEVVDVLADTQPDDSSKSVALARGWRSRLVVPLKGDNAVIGFISITRKQPGAFADKDKELVRTFADQAVIAIQNVGLFEEVQARTRDLQESLQQQTATADVLKVISRSVFDLQAVLDTLVESAYKLCGASLGLLYLRTDEAFECKAIAGVGVAEADQLFKGRPIRAGRRTAAERVILTGEVHAITDFFTDPEFDPVVRDRIRSDPSDSGISKLRSTLAVPMTRENEVVGVLVIARPQTGTFPQRQVELLQTFADQAVIAISNAELFRQVQERTRELSQSLDDLRAAQDRLVQTEKLASLGQLTAGIAHEIKNPLNFINNFSALSVELTDELNDILRRAELVDKIEQEVSELTQLLKSNLEKVVQHGKRADSIVKNMLLHSREGSGEQRAADINALVEESLNLAYHGARAEKSGFDITLHREFDAGAGSAELFPQEITRALLNLISNGFYAATRRKAENGDGAFEPALLATTKDIGGSVQIRIRDNGTGIPPEVKEKMFNPFFTTKPAGEGTGLGLSMTHDIIVKQHGGTIDVATEPGHFTEFIVVLPRANGSQNKIRGKS